MRGQRNPCLTRPLAARGNGGGLGSIAGVFGPEAAVLRQADAVDLRQLIGGEGEVGDAAYAVQHLFGL